MLFYRGGKNFTPPIANPFIRGDPLEPRKLNGSSLLGDRASGFVTKLDDNVITNFANFF